MVLKLKNWVVFLIIFVEPPMIVYGLGLVDPDYFKGDLLRPFQLTMILMTAIQISYIGYLNIKLSIIAKRSLTFPILSLVILFLFILSIFLIKVPQFLVNSEVPADPFVNTIPKLILGTAVIFYMFVNISECLNEISVQKKDVVVRVIHLWMLPIGIWSIQNELNKISN